MPEQQISKLSLRVNHCSETRKLSQALEAEGKSLPFGVYANHFGYMLVLPQDEGPEEVVTADKLGSMNISFSDACIKAIANGMAEIGTDVEWDCLVGNDDVVEFYVSNWSMNHHPVGMFNSDFGVLPTRGDTIIFPISKDKLIVTGSESAAGLAMVLSEWEANSYILPPFGLQLKKGKTTLWAPPITHLAHQPFNRHKYIYLNRIYGHQCNKMRQGLEDPDFYFPAKYVLVQEGDRLRSYATVTEGILKTSLPLVDYVHFVAMDEDPTSAKEIASAPWAALCELLGDRIALEPSTYPTRYVLTGFLNQSDIEQLNTVVD